MVEHEGVKKIQKLSKVGQSCYALTLLRLHKCCSICITKKGNEPKNLWKMNKVNTKLCTKCIPHGLEDHVQSYFSHGHIHILTVTNHNGQNSKNEFNFARFPSHKKFCSANKRFVDNVYF